MVVERSIPEVITPTATPAPVERHWCTLWVRDDGRVEAANEFAARLLGCTVAELMGTDVRQIDSEFPYAQCLEVWKTQTNGAAVLFTSQLRRPDGGIRTVEMEVARPAGIEPRYWLITFREPRASQEATAETKLDLAHAEDGFTPPPETALPPSSAPGDLRWRWLVESAPDMIFIVDRVGRVRYVNRALPGIAREDLIGILVYDFIFPEFHEKVRSSFEQVLATGAPQRYEVASLGANGTLAWYATRVGPIRQQGRIVAMLLIARDITERKRSEELLREARDSLDARVLERTQALTQANARLVQEVASREQAETELKRQEALATSILNGMPDGVAVIDLDGRRMLLNPAGRRLMGDPQFNSIAEAMEVLEVRHADGVTVWPLEDLPIMQAMRGESVTGAEVFLPQLRASEGLWLRASAWPLLDEGRPRGAVAVFSDITQRKADERALVDAEERFRELTSNANEVFWVRDAATGAFQYVSPAFEEIYGWSCAEACEDPQVFRRAVHAEDFPLVQQMLEQVATGQAAQCEYRIVRPDGTQRWVHSRAFPVRNAQGQVHRITGVAADITARRQAEARLERQVRRQTVLAELASRALNQRELQPILDEAARLTCQSMDSSFCAVAVFDVEKGQLVLEAGSGPDGELPPGFRMNETSAPTDGCCAGHAIRTQRPVVMTDVDTERRFDTTVSKQLGLRSAACAPIKLPSGYFGALGAYRLEPSEFLADDVRFLEAMSHVLAGAIERVRTEAALRESESRLRSLLENSPDAILTVDEGGTVRFASAALPGLPLESSLGQGIFRSVAPEYQARFAQALGRVFEKGKRDSLEHQAVDGTWRIARIVPLRDEGAVTAAIVISTDITRRKYADMRLQRNQELLQQTLVVHEQDRRLISYEIHDGVVQDLTGALMHLEAVAAQGAALPARAQQELTRVQELLRRTIDEGRRLISGLRPPIIDEMGILAAIEYLINERRGETVIPIEFVHDVQFERLDPLLESTVFRIVQEALTNVYRHSKTRRARIKLIQAGDLLQLRVRDWGVGFDPRKTNSRRYGLRGMRERARMLKGRFRVDSAPGKGTRVAVELPVSLESIRRPETS